MLCWMGSLINKGRLERDQLVHPQDCRRTGFMVQQVCVLKSSRDQGE